MSGISFHSVVKKSLGLIECRDFTHSFCKEQVDENKKHGGERIHIEFVCEKAGRMNRNDQVIQLFIENVTSSSWYVPVVSYSFLSPIRLTSTCIMK